MCVKLVRLCRNTRRTTVFVLEGIKNDKQSYIEWLLNQCSKTTSKKTNQLFTEEAISILAERLATPLQIEQHVTLALEEAYKIGQKPVTPEIMESIMSKEINNLEPKLTRHGYSVKAISGLLNVKPAEVRSFLHGQLAPGRTQELQKEMLAAGIPI